MRLQKAPIGLLGAFALKVDGMNPPSFSDMLVPTVDVWDQYVSDNMQRAGVVATINAAATTSAAALLTPTQGKLWRVLAVGATHAVNVADVAINFFLAWGLLPPSGVRQDTDARQTLGAPTARACGIPLARPFFLPPGWSISLQALASAAPANATAFSCNALVQEFDA